jgi:hypothetical protein
MPFYIWHPQLCVLKVQALVTSLIIPALTGGNETNIFLVSANNPRYGFYNWSDAGWYGGKVHEGDPCFIVNVTVRNDYTDPILGDSPLNGTYYEYVSLTALIFTISKVKLTQWMLPTQLIEFGVVTGFL